MHINPMLFSFLPSIMVVPIVSVFLFVHCKYLEVSNKSRLKWPFRWWFSLIGIILFIFLNELIMHEEENS